MAQVMRGVLGAVSWGVCALAALASVGCGSSDNSSNADGCGTQLAPTEFTVIDVVPAPGSSVSNSDIVQSFTIAGQLIQLTPNFAKTMAHTAGSPSANVVNWALTQSASGKDSVYTSEPLTWTTAPGHVELVAGDVFQNTTTRCFWQFPAPMFSYDITAP